MRYKIYLINGQGIISFSARVHLISVVMISDASQKIIQFLRTWGKNYSILVEPIFSVWVWVCLTLPITISHFEGCHTYSKEFKKIHFQKIFWNEVEGAQRMKYFCWTMKVQKRTQFRPMCFGHAKQSDCLNYLPYYTVTVDLKEIWNVFF